MGRKRNLTFIVQMLLVLLVNAEEWYVRISKGLTAIPSDIPSNAFFVDLTDNDITRTNAQDLSGFPLMKYLFLSYNQIGILPIKAFKESPIEHLGLSGNKFRAVPDLCHLAETLEGLFLHRNNIQKVDPQYINCLKHLSTLTLGLNPFTTIPETTFSGQVHFESLNLGFTGIRRPPVLLNIRVNELYISNTNLTTFPDPEPMNTIINELYMQGTYFICDCSLAWLKLGTERGWPKKVYTAEYPCKEPPELAGVQWKDIHLDQLKCNGNFDVETTQTLDDQP